MSLATGIKHTNRCYIFTDSAVTSADRIWTQTKLWTKRIGAKCVVSGAGGWDELVRIGEMDCPPIGRGVDALAYVRQVLVPHLAQSCPKDLAQVDLLISLRGRLFSVDGEHRSVAEHALYEAVGNASPYAIGALAVTYDGLTRQGLVKSVKFMYNQLVKCVAGIDKNVKFDFT